MKATTIELITPANLIGSFAELVQQGIDAWERAGKLLVEMINQDPGIRSKIIERCPHLSEAILSRFEAIGRRVLHPKTLLNSSPGMVRLRDLPYDEQDQYLTEPVSVVVALPSGKTDVQKIMISALTRSQALQVIGKDGIRSLADQRKFLEKKGLIQKPSTHVRDGSVSATAHLSNAGMNGQRFDFDEEDDETEERPVSELILGAAGRMDAALLAAQQALMDARVELTMINHDHPMDNYIAGCLKGVGMLRLALSEGRIK